MCTSLKSQQCVHVTKLLQITGLTGPSSVGSQLYKTIVRAFCHLQYVELSYAHQSMIYIVMRMCIENCKIFIICVWPTCHDDHCLVTLLTFVWSSTSLWLISQFYWWIKVFLLPHFSETLPTVCSRSVTSNIKLLFTFSWETEYSYATSSKLRDVLGL